MSFFLLGKDTDDELRLLSSKPLASRQEAMAELSRLTADPSFEHWDSEVFVMELDKGTPVLLMRPADVTQPAAPEEPEPAEETVVDAEQDETPETDQGEVSEAETDEVEPEAVDPDTTPDADPALAAVIEDLHSDDTVAPDDAVADASISSETEDSVVVVADEPVVVAPIETEQADETLVSEDEAAPSLKDAIKRTAAHMESEGIVAPDSVGPAAGGEDQVAAWPWATSSSDEGFSLDALEEPAREATPLVTAAGDEDTVAASRPVILGSYADERALDVPLQPQEPIEPAWPGPSSDEPAEPVQEVTLVDPESIEPPVTEPASEAAPVPDTSDFILDLEPVTPAMPSPDMTCEDCVYVRTCPNSGQRDPKDCGSFQWK